MHERDAVEVEHLKVVHGDRILRLGIDRRVENRLIRRERRLGLSVDVDDVAQLLERTENEERVDQQREELADGDLLVEDQVEHEEQNRRADQIDARPLDEAQTSDVANLLQLQLEDLLGRRVQPADLLFGEAEALDQLDVAQGLRGSAGESGRFGHDDLLNDLDAPAQDHAKRAEDGDGGQEGGRDRPVDLIGVDHDDDHTHEAREQNVHERGDELLGVG